MPIYCRRDATLAFCRGQVASSFDCRSEGLRFEPMRPRPFVGVPPKVKMLSRPRVARCPFSDRLTRLRPLAAHEPRAFSIVC